MTDFVVHDDFQIASRCSADSGKSRWMSPGIVHEFTVFRSHAAKLTGFWIRIPGTFFKNFWLEYFAAKSFDSGRCEQGEWFCDADLGGCLGSYRGRKLEIVESVSCFRLLETEMLVGVER